MDTNQQKNLQINLFLQGMDMDTSDMLISDQKYRYAENIRLITNSDNNSGEVRLVEGNKFISVKSNDVPIKGDVLALDSIRDLVVLINKVETSWNIYTIDINTGNATLIFGPCNEPIWPDGWDGKGKIINTTLRWESNNNIKLYIADGIHNIMAIQLAQGKQDYSFDKLFEYQMTPLKAPTVQILIGGALKSAIIQYSYRLYKENGNATQPSPMSEPCSLYRSQVKGYGPNKPTNRSTIVHIPEEISGVFDKIQLYRITYQQAGSDPIVELVIDQDFVTLDIVDLGTSSLEEISVQEFLSYYNVLISPKLIESKGDHLFASNLKYIQDGIDDKFKKFDARSYNLGAKYVKDGSTKQIIQIDGDYNFKSADFPDETSSIINDAFANLQNISNYTYGYWKEINLNGKQYNGIGPFFGWKYIYKENVKIYDTKNVSVVNLEDNACRSYRRGEIYRFGVVLYDKKGIKSSAKWIADILIPLGTPITINNNGEIFAKFIGIQFEPLNTSDPIWEEISGYEIVLCERTINDRLTISQGIVGHVHTVSLMYWKNGKIIEKPENYLTPIGFMSLEDIRGISLDYDHNSVLNNLIGFYQIGEGNPGELSKIANPKRNIIQFASPEYVYLSDDVKDIIESKQSSLYLLLSTNYIPLSGPSNEIAKAEGDLREYDEMLINMSDSDNKYIGGITRFVKANDDYLPYDAYALGVLYPVNGCTNKINYPTYVYNAATAIYNGAGEKSNYRDNDDGSYPWLNGGFFSYRGVQGTNGSPNKKPYRKIKDTTFTYEQGTYLAGTLHFFNHMVPSQQDSTFILNIDIDKAYYVDSPQYYDFAREGSFTFNSNSTAVSGYSFINWTNPFIVVNDSENLKRIKDILADTFYGVDAVNINWGGASSLLDSCYPTGSGGKAILFKIDRDITFQRNVTSLHESMPSINVMDLRQKINPYGGYTKSAILNSKYISVGAYQSGTNSIDVFEGDSFIQMFSYNSAHEWYDPQMVRARKNAIVYTVPVETYIDLRAQYSDSLFAYTTTSNKVQDRPSSFDGYSQEDSSYLYNTAYNAVTNIVSFVADNRTRGLINNYDTRIHYSGLKTNNEPIDNWTQFKALDFLDVDSRYGEITALLLFKDKLIFWQNNATGVLSVNERSVVLDDNGNSLVIGSGGILDRYDYITTTYGQKKDQYNLTNSDTTLYWWDGNHKEILGFGDRIIPLTTTKSVKNYINTHEENNTPQIVYDTKYKEVICNVVGDESLVYSELILAFTAVYKYTPNFYCNVFGDNYTTLTTFGLYKENTSTEDKSSLFNVNVYPVLQYVVNTSSSVNKVFDNQLFGGRFYKGDVSHLLFEYNTPLKLKANGTGKDLVTDREYDFRLAIPRNSHTSINQDFGDRMRGKTMQCVIKSDSNDLDFSLQYVITKFRVSWT